MGIEDIWGEKPNWWWTEPDGLGKMIYNKGEMDAWLEKLKTHYEPIEEKADGMLRFRTAAEDLGEYAADLNDKLEAIKTHLQDFPDEKDPKYSGREDLSTRHVVWNMPYFLTDLETWFNTFKKILGG